jgi:hypothetical protein
MKPEGFVEVFSSALSILANAACTWLVNSNLKPSPILLTGDTTMDGLEPLTLGSDMGCSQQNVDSTLCTKCWSHQLCLFSSIWELSPLHL